VILPKELNSCFPGCEFFRCGQRALNYQGKRAYCRWADDDCAGATCNYTVCLKGRLLPNGTCGLTIKRKTSEEATPDTMKLPEIRLHGRMQKKIGEDELF